MKAKDEEDGFDWLGAALDLLAVLMIALVLGVAAWLAKTSGWGYAELFLLIVGTGYNIGRWHAGKRFDRERSKIADDLQGIVDSVPDAPPVLSLKDWNDAEGHFEVLVMSIEESLSHRGILDIELRHALERALSEVYAEKARLEGT